MILSLNGIIAGKGVIPSTLLTNLYSVYKAESNANDSLGTNNGTAVGGLTYTAGKSGDSFTYNGSNAYVQLPNNSLNFTGDFSISTWVNLQSLTGVQPLVNNFKELTNYYGYLLFIFNSNLYFRICDGVTTNIYDITTSFTSTNTWKHIVITRKRSVTTKIYIDGVLITSANTIDQVYHSTMQYARIGGYNDTNGDKFLSNGSKVDEVGLWTKELTATEVTELYRCGSGSFYPYVSLPTLDSDACAFIGAASITDSTQKSAINQLVLDLKTANIWTKMKAIYPFVGGNASSHRFNLKDPRTVSGAYYLNFYGGGTHSANGYQPDGATAYADTQLNANSIMGLNDFHITFYSRTNSTSNSYEFGVGNSASERIGMGAYWNSGLPEASAFSTVQNNIPNTGNRTDKCFILNKTTSTSFDLFINTTKQTKTITTATKPNFNLWIGCLNYQNTGYYYTNRQCAFASIGDGLTDSEATAFYNAVQNFNTTLARNV